MELQNFITDNYQAKADFHFEKEEMQLFFNNAYRQLLPIIQIPGFRKGKAPFHMARQYVNKEKLLEEIMETMVRKSLDYLFEHKKEYDFIYPPSLAGDEWPEEEQDYTLKLLIEFFPDVSLDDIEHLKIPIELSKTREDFKQEAINSLLNANATYNDLTSTPADGNFAIIEYCYNHQSEKPTFNTAMVELGKNQILPESDEEIMKMNPGEEKVLTYTSDGLEEPMSIKVKLMGFKEKILPELSQSFLDSIQAGKTLEEYLDQIDAQALKNFEEYEQNIRWDAFFEEWFKTHLIENLPQNIMDHYNDQAMDLFEQELSTSRLSLEEFLSKTEKTIEDLREQLKPKALIKANVDLLIRSILKENKELIPTENEINEESNQFLGKYKEEQKEIDKDRLYSWCETNLRRKNALQWLTKKIYFIDN
jgi:trigger factor